MIDNPSRILNGSCVGGTVRYAVPGAFRYAVTCACRCAELAPSKHIIVGSKAPWFTFTDELQRHPELPS